MLDIKKSIFKQALFPLMLGGFSMNALAMINVLDDPAPVVQEAAKQFQKNTSIEVDVTAGPTAH